MKNLFRFFVWKTNTKKIKLWQNFGYHKKRKMIKKKIMTSLVKNYVE